MNGQPRRLSETQNNKHYETELEKKKKNKDNAKYKRKMLFLLIYSERRGHCIHGIKTECHLKKFNQTNKNNSQKLKI